MSAAVGVVGVLGHFAAASGRRRGPAVLAGLKPSGKRRDSSGEEAGLRGADGGLRAYLKEPFDVGLTHIVLLPLAQRRLAPQPLQRASPHCLVVHHPLQGLSSSRSTSPFRFIASHLLFSWRL